MINLRKFFARFYPVCITCHDFSKVGNTEDIHLIPAVRKIYTKHTNMKENCSGPWGNGFEKTAEFP
jgi:hypothetical protein